MDIDINSRILKKEKKKGGRNGFVGFLRRRRMDGWMDGCIYIWKERLACMMGLIMRDIEGIK